MLCMLIQKNDKLYIQTIKVENVYKLGDWQKIIITYKTKNY